MKKNLMMTVTAILVALQVLTAETAWADNVISYRDAIDSQQTATGVNILDENSLTMSDGWYIANDNLTIGSRVSVSGHAKLILKDGVMLHIPKGITVEEDNSLTIYGQDGGTGSLTIDNVGSSCAGIGVMTGSGNSGGTVTICGGVVNVKGGSLACDIGGLCGLLAENAEGGTITICGGQVTTSGPFGIGGMKTSSLSNNAMVTLGYNRTTDFIKASSLALTSSVTIADGKQFYDGTNTYSGTLTSDQISTLAHKTLRPYNPITITYIDMSGDEQQCISCNALTGNESTIAPGWYVADGTVSFDHPVSVAGDVHIILKDDAVVNIGTAESPVEGYGIGNDNANHSISIYGQSTGTNNGQLNVYSTASGICSMNGDVNCSSVRIMASTSSVSGILASNNNDSGTANINLKNATIYATGQYGLCANDNLNIDGGEVTAIGSDYGLFAKEGSVTISDGEVTATANTSGIYAQKGSVNISGGMVAATGDKCDGMDANNDITISGGEVRAKGVIYGMYAQNVTIGGGQVIAEGTTKGIYASDDIVLGWARSADFILANSYGVHHGSISIAEGKSFTTEEGTTYSGTIAFENNACAIDNKMLFFPIAIEVYYLDMNGEQQTCPSYIPLTGTETTLAADWYVAEGTVSFDHPLSVAGDVHIILKDGAVMNVGTAESPIENFGIGDDRAKHSISIYGQSTGAENGQLNMYSTKACIWAFNGDFNCSSARITASSSRGYTIWALNYNETGTGNLRLKDATVDVTGVYGLYAQRGNLSIDGGKVTATGSASNYGIFANTGSITVSNGEVTATGGNAGIYAENGSLTISGGKVTGNGYNHHGIDAKDITISGGEVRAVGEIHGMNAQNGDVNISGGKVLATGNSGYPSGIYASHDIILGWTRSTDFILANSYKPKYGSMKIAEGKAFVDEDGTTYSGTIAFENDVCALNSKTLRPYSNSQLFLADDADNTAVISSFNGQKYDVTLAGRTLLKDGYWNTLCLPFNVSDGDVYAGQSSSSGGSDGKTFTGTPLIGAEAMAYDHAEFSVATGTLEIIFAPVYSVEAGTPFIVRWTSPEDYEAYDPALDNAATCSDLVSPTFTGVTIDHSTNAQKCMTQAWDGVIADSPGAASFDFVGTYDPVRFAAGTAHRDVLFLGAASTLYYPDGQADTSINAFRAYFRLTGITAGDTADPNTVRAFVLNLGDGSVENGIGGLTSVPSPKGEGSDCWYTLDGRRLNGMPAAPGLYIHGNKKVIIK